MLAGERMEEEWNERSAVSLAIHRYGSYTANTALWVLCIGEILAALWIHHSFTSPLESFGLIHIQLEPTTALITLAFATLLIVCIGCAATLRDNVCLLKTYTFNLLLLSTFHLTLAIAYFSFAYVAPNVELTSSHSMYQLIKTYSDSADSRTVMDSLQKQYSCCGIHSRGYEDWNLNVYYNCTAGNPSVESCGVPFSCCIGVASDNLLCGAGVGRVSPHNLNQLIYTEGCVDAIWRVLYGCSLFLGFLCLFIASVLFATAFLAARATYSIHLHTQHLSKVYHMVREV